MGVMTTDGKESGGHDARRLHKSALRMARQCRRIIQACLREEEWHDADEEFYAVILAGMKDHARQISKSE